MLSNLSSSKGVLFLFFHELLLKSSYYTGKWNTFLWKLLPKFVFCRSTTFSFPYYVLCRIANSRNGLVIKASRGALWTTNVYYNSQQTSNYSQLKRAKLHCCSLFVCACTSRMRARFTRWPCHLLGLPGSRERPIAPNEFTVLTNLNEISKASIIKVAVSLFIL